MKLHEEFREYETMWEASKALEESADPVSEILAKIPDYELEYEGYEYEWDEDKFDPNSWYGHYQVSHTDYQDDFTYEVDAVSLYETVFDILQKKVEEPTESDLIRECKELMQAWWKASDDEEAERLAAVELFVAQNLETFADMCYDELLAEYKELAYSDKPGRDD